MDAKIPRGRRPFPPEKRRSGLLKIRVTAGELRQLERGAAGEAVSTWLREVGLREAKRK